MNVKYPVEALALSMILFSTNMKEAFIAGAFIPVSYTHLNSHGHIHKKSGETCDDELAEFHYRTDRTYKLQRIPLAKEM